MNKTDIRNLFPDATDDAVKALLDINSADITHALNKQANDRAELEGRIKTLTDTITAKESELTTATAKYNADIEALNSKIADADAAKAVEIKAINDKLKEAQGKAAGLRTMQAQIDQLTKDIAARDATLADTTKRYRIKDALREQKARNVDVLMPLLKMDSIGEDENGNLTGFAEQIDALKKSDAYLFDLNDGNVRGGFSGAQDLGGKSDTNSIMNDTIRSLAGRGN